MSHVACVSNVAEPVARRGSLRRRSVLAIIGLLLSAAPLISTGSSVSAEPVETSAASQVASPAAAAGAPDRELGYDVSYPQCPAVAATPPSLPPSAAFTIIGVNDGLAYSENACFVQLYRWAQEHSRVGNGDDNGNGNADIAFYANTGNPGPVLSKRWPTGQRFPRACDGSWSVACSYDYGWNSAGYTVDVVEAKLPGVARNATWWLDVETANSWNKTDLATNAAALEGFRDRLAFEAPSQTVGFYSNQRQWGLITGATAAGSRINAPFADAPNWVAGATESTAHEYCGDSFTGAPVVLVQYVKDGLDHDERC